MYGLAIQSRIRPGLAGRSSLGFVQPVYDNTKTLGQKLEAIVPGYKSQETVDAERKAADAAADRAHQERMAAINAEINALKNQRYTPPMWTSSLMGDQYQGEGVVKKTRKRGSGMRANNQLKVNSANTGGGSSSTANLG
jgi:predicted AAA+ superfamily ATPase